MNKHTRLIEELISDPDYNKELEKMIIDTGYQQIEVFPDYYKPIYDELAFQIMSEENSTLSHLANYFNVMKQTISDWIRRYPTFMKNVELGKIKSEIKFRDKLSDVAFRPSNEVNNQMIALIAHNVHDISINNAPQIMIQNNNQNNQNNLSTEESSKLYEDAILNDEN